MNDSLSWFAETATSIDIGFSSVYLPFPQEVRTLGKPILTPQEVRIAAAVANRYPRGYAEYWGHSGPLRVEGDGSRLPERVYEKDVASGCPAVAVAWSRRQNRRYVTADEIVRAADDIRKYYKYALARPYGPVCTWTEDMKYNPVRVAQDLLASLNPAGTNVESTLAPFPAA